MPEICQVGASKEKVDVGSVKRFVRPPAMPGTPLPLPALVGEAFSPGIGLQTGSERKALKGFLSVFMFAYPALDQRPYSGDWDSLPLAFLSGEIS